MTLDLWHIIITATLDVRLLLDKTLTIAPGPKKVSAEPTAAIGPAVQSRLRRELPQILAGADERLPALARQVLGELSEQMKALEQRISAYDRQIRQLAQASEAAQRLMKIEAIGPQTATALVAAVADPHVFKNGRSFAAWLGMTPRQHSSGGKARLGQITRQGDRYLRTLLVHGARAYLRVVEKKTDAKSKE